MFKHVARAITVPASARLTPQARSRSTAPVAVADASKWDSPFTGVAAMTAGCVIGWLIISTAGRRIVELDEMQRLTAAWLGQFVWGSGIAIAFGLLGMSRARRAVLTVLALALMLTVICVAFAAMMTPWS